MDGVIWIGANQSPSFRLSSSRWVEAHLDKADVELVGDLDDGLFAGQGLVDLLHEHDEHGVALLCDSLHLVK